MHLCWEGTCSIRPNNLGRRGGLIKGALYQLLTRFLFWKNIKHWLTEICRIFSQRVSFVKVRDTNGTLYTIDRLKSPQRMKWEIPVKESNIWKEMVSFFGEEKHNFSVRTLWQIKEHRVLQWWQAMFVRGNDLLVCQAKWAGCLSDQRVGLFVQTTKAGYQEIIGHQKCHKFHVLRLAILWW